MLLLTGRISLTRNNGRYACARGPLTGDEVAALIVIAVLYVVAWWVL